MSYICELSMNLIYYRQVYEEQGMKALQIENSRRKRKNTKLAKSLEKSGPVYGTICLIFVSYP